VRLRPPAPRWQARPYRHRSRRHGRLDARLVTVVAALAVLISLAAVAGSSPALPPAAAPPIRAIAGGGFGGSDGLPGAATDAADISPPSAQAPTAPPPTLAPLAPADGGPANPPTAGTVDPVPECSHRDVRTSRRGADEWAITLLDPVFRLPQSYVPPNLVPITQAGLASSQLIRAEVIPDLRRMARAARRAGASLAVRAGYRSFADQAVTFVRWQAMWGHERALVVSARAGHSEHQLGTAIDFRSADSSRAPWDYQDWGKTDAGRWMRQNSWRYGFVMSYPPGMQAETCYDYEPWHFRYVGVELAADVQMSGLSLRRYLWRNFEVAARR